MRVSPTVVPHGIDWSDWQHAEENTNIARDALVVAEREREEALVHIGETTEEIRVLRQSRISMRNQITILTVASTEAQAQFDTVLFDQQTTIDEFLAAPPPPDYESCLETASASYALIRTQDNVIQKLRALDGAKAVEITTLNTENDLLQKNFDRLFGVHAKDVQTFDTFRVSIERQLELTEKELSAMKRKSAFNFLRPKITINLISVGFGLDDQKIHPMIGIGVGWAF